MTVAADKPTTIDSLHIGIESGIAVILNQTSLPRELLSLIFSLGFFYSPVVAIVDIQDRHNPKYALFQQGKIVDLDWICNTLSRFEDGWHINENGILVSPDPSKLDKSAVLETLVGAKKEH